MSEYTPETPMTPDGLRTAIEQGWHQDMLLAAADAWAADIARQDALSQMREAIRLTIDSLVVRSFQKGGISYGGDKWTISQQAVDSLRAALAQEKLT